MQSPRRQDLDYSIEQIESELAYRRARETLQFNPPTMDERQRRLLPYVLHNVPDYLPGWVHVFLCETLEQFARDIEERRSPRLLITMPPRAGKSEITSCNFPTWYLGRNPRHEVVVASYGQELADKMSAKARLYRDANLDIFPTLAPRRGGKDGVQFWDTLGGGSYNAVGAGGPLVGQGFHLGIIDDPIKNPKAAASEIEREALWEWYQGAFYTRAAPGAGILGMATRWHHDDLLGRIIEAMQKELGEQFVVIDLPAIAEVDEYHPKTGQLFRKAGEALHPERYDVADYARIRQNAGERVWLAQYQCRPTSAKGGTFKRDWYANSVDPEDWMRPASQFDERALTIDTNLKKGSGNARASIAGWGRRGYTEYTRLCERVGSYSYPELRKHAHELALQVRPNFILIEEAAVGPALIADLEELGWTVIAFKPARWGSKEQRAELAAVHHEAGKIRLHQAAWNDEWLEEHVNFPLSKYKDRVDEGAQLLIYWQERARESGSLGSAVEATNLLSQLMGGS